MYPKVFGIGFAGRPAYDKQQRGELLKVTGIIDVRGTPKAVFWQSVTALLVDYTHWLFTNNLTWDVSLISPILVV